VYSKIIHIAYNDIGYINDVTIGIDYTSCAIALTIAIEYSLLCN